MDAFMGAFAIFAVIFLAAVLAGVLTVWWSIRARKAARLEMKHHVQRIDASEST